MKTNNINKNKKILAASLLAVALGVIGISLLFTNKKENNSIEENESNDVLLDSFAYSFLKLETKNKNLVYSPLSIKYALLMLNEGADGKTKEEIEKVLKNLSVTKYDNINKTLSLANAVFIRDTYKEYVKEDYINSIKEKYNAETFYDSFKNADNVNNWISEKTFELIKDMVKDSVVKNPNLEMILVNALAIDMEWLDSFEAKNTRQQDFTKGKNDVIKVAMMHKSTKSKSYKYYQDEKVDILSMPLKDYDETSLEFIAIRPKDTSLYEFITNDNFDKELDENLSKLHETNNEELSISIPRFDFEYDLNLKNDLKILGINEAFDEQLANFDNMSKRGLYVNDALHKANVKLSEKGVKASAATVIYMFDKAAILEEEKIVYLNYNQPFMFVIRDSKTNEVWFLGTVYNPIEWEDIKGEYNYK